jgi:hypothetical protein
MLPGARLFSYTGEEYGWLTKGYEVFRRQIRGVREGRKEVRLRQVRRREAEVLFTGETVNPVKYTRVLVTFEIEGTHMK